MKRIICMGIIGILFVSFAIAYAQKDKAPASKERILFQSKSLPESQTIDENYVIGIDDVIEISVWKEEGLSKSLVVRMDGKISFPFVDDIVAAGLTPLQVKEELTKKLKEYVEEPIVTVTVREVNSRKVYISGNVKSPGTYKIRNETSVAQLISLAGGLTDWASPAKIIVIRRENGKETAIKVNYKKIIKGEDLNTNIVLKPGDTVLVP